MQKSLLFSLFLSFHLYSTSLAGLVAEQGRGEKGEKEYYKGKDNNSQVKLFVFGDSYADTGNWNKVASSWKPPYGITYPGQPAGRFSDGQILTDFVASFFQIESPIPYEQWNLLSGPERLQKLGVGINFAYGGTGVFDTDVSGPNMTAQIDILDRLTGQFRPDFNSSIALLSVCGNDYSHFLRHPTNLTVLEITKSIIDQVTVNLERIHSLGVQKVIVTKLEPIGCVPASTFIFGYANCTQSLNDVASSHNTLLQQSVDLLNNKANDGTFFTLDLYGAFLSYLRPGNLKLEDLLKPCCQGITTSYECGSMEGKEAKYTICEKPSMAFFWDEVHPTQNGWYQVYMAIKPTLESILITKQIVLSF